MKSKFPSKFKEQPAQQKQSELPESPKVNYVPEVEKAQAEKQAIFEASNKPDLEAIGRAAKAQADDDAKQASNEKYASKASLGSGMLGEGLWMPPYPMVPTTAPYREPRWLTTGEAAKHIKVSPTKFIKLRADGMKFYKLKDDTILYNVHDLNDWVMQQVAEVKS